MEIQGIVMSCVVCDKRWDTQSQLVPQVADADWRFCPFCGQQLSKQPYTSTSAGTTLIRGDKPKRVKALRLERRRA